MKYSQFNSIAHMENSHVLFNSLSKKVIFLEEKLRDTLTGIVDNVDALRAIHPTFYEYLSEHQFIVDDEIDEIDVIKRLSKETDENYSSFLLTINPNMTCNFGCYYCYESHTARSRIGGETTEKIKRFVSRTVRGEGLEYFPIAFFGGEPLLYFQKDVVPIIDHYITECRSMGLEPEVSFTTNGYLVGTDFIDYFKHKQLQCSLQITLDGSRQNHDLVRFTKTGKGSYERIVENIILLAKSNFFVRVRINYTDENIWSAAEIVNDLSSLTDDEKGLLLFDFHRVWQNDRQDDIGEILQTQLDIIRQSGFEVSSKYLMDNVLNPCYADKLNSVVINYNGDIYKCTARDFTRANRAGFINGDGRLIWEDGYLQRRMNAKFNNPPCLKCRILPICNGGCSQHALEHLNGDAYCVYFGDEQEKDKVVIANVREVLENQTQSVPDL